MERNYEQAYNVLKEKLQEVVKERERFRKNRNKWRLKCKKVRIENKMIRQQYPNSLICTLKVLEQDVQDLCDVLEKFRTANAWERFLYFLTGR